MNQLLLGMALFFGMHSVCIAAPKLRDQMAATNPLGWRLVYSVLSVVGLILIVRGYAEARLTPSVLYTTPDWMRYVASVLLLPVFTLLLAPYFPGRIRSATKHPMLVATKLWALAHLLVNGMLHDVILFGAFLVWAVADRISMKRRVLRPLPGVPESNTNDIVIVVIGLAVYGVTAVWAHEALFGVRPIPL